MKKPAALALALSLWTAACGPSLKPVIVGSKTDTEQTILGEIVAQHLEARTQGPIQRRLGLGGTEILYQAFITGDVNIYPEYTGNIGTMILKETPSADAAIALERARSEIGRVAQADLFGPLGFANPPVLVVRAADAGKIGTLSEAAEGATKWKIGVTFEFQQRNDGLSLLNSYRLPMGAPVRSMDLKQLFPALASGDITMIAASATDGQLLSNAWKILADDRKVFPPQQAVLLGRQEILNQDPRIRAALSELAGKFSEETMRKLNAQVEVDKMPVSVVAAGFLASAGLK